MKNIFLFLILVVFVAVGCEDVIEVDTDFEEPQLVVDGWIDDMNRPQTIRLTLSQDYFENEFADGVTDATVTVTRNGEEVLDFLPQGNGDYVWTPEDRTLGNVGDTFVLNIEWNGNTYSSASTMNRVPEIDSIGFEFREGEFGFEDGLYAGLFVKDFAGVGDTYWAKTWKNDTLLNKPNELNIVYDATFDAGTILDGVAWIVPLREAINPIADSDRENDTFQIPYVPGDKIYCEVLSINNEAFRFMQLAIEQMTNGDNGIFTLPIANTRGNVTRDTDGELVLGMFNVAAVSTIEVVVE